MSYSVLVEKFDSESSGVVSLDSSCFCSKECVSEFLFENFEVEGVEAKDGILIQLTDINISVVESEDIFSCEYGC